MYRTPTATTVALVILWPYPAFADTPTGKVVKITDGDTVYGLDANYQQHKIRLAGIDAPERKQARKTSCLEDPLKWESIGLY